MYFDSDWESGDGGWTFDGFLHGSNPYGGTGFAPANPGAFSGVNYWFAPDTGFGATDHLTSPTYVMTAGDMFLNLTFTHHYNLETGFDGGAVLIQVNGGSFNYVPAPNVTDYDQVMDASTDTLGGLEAYTGNSGGAYFTSNVNLSSLVNPGDSFAIRFAQGEDSSGSGDGWYIDDLTLSSSVSAIPEPTALAMFSSVAVVLLRRRKSVCL
ncbi:MAG: PEP-CTERM sorting domain-containing protein [Planctomycetota bacterium]